MKISKNIWIIVVIVVILGGLYWWSSKEKGSIQQKSVQTVSLPGVININIDNSALGNFLVASNGMTLYYFTKDTLGLSNCYDGCSTIWSPYIVPTPGGLPKGEGITGKISTINRIGGLLQLTYDGAPLYFYSKDVNPGDTTGQNVNGTWFMVKP